jgi:hypothetical protein
MNTRFNSAVSGGAEMRHGALRNHPRPLQPPVRVINVRGPHDPAKAPKLFDRLHEALRVRHYSRRTEETYCHWVKRFIFFHNVRHPDEMAEPEINAFLTNLAVKENVSASTQNQALSGLLFLYRHVLAREIGNLGEVIRAKRPQRVPVVLTRTEVKAVLDQLTGDKRLMATLLYGAPSMVYEPAYTDLYIPEAARMLNAIYHIDIQKDCAVLLQAAEPLYTEAERLRLPNNAELYIYCWASQTHPRAPNPN